MLSFFLFQNIYLHSLDCMFMNLFANQPAYFNYIARLLIWVWMYYKIINATYHASQDEMGGGSGDKIKPPKNLICMFVPNHACILQLLPQIHCFQAQKSALIQTFGLKWGLGYCGLHFLLFTFLVLQLFISVSVFTFTIYYFRFSSLMPVVPCPSISMDLIVPWDQINWNYKIKKHPMESVLSRRSIATNFQLGEMDSGESEPPAPKFWFLLGFHRLYIENRGATMKFWLAGGGGADSVLSNPPTTKLFSPWILATLFWKSWIM